MATEKQLQAKIIKKLNSLPGVWARANVATAYTGRGNPDIDGCCYGRAFYLEVKLPGRKADPIQHQKMMLITQKSGGYCTVVHSVEDAVACMSVLSAEKWDS